MSKTTLLYALGAGAIFYILWSRRGKGMGAYRRPRFSVPLFNCANTSPAGALVFAAKTAAQRRDYRACSRAACPPGSEFFVLADGRAVCAQKCSWPAAFSPRAMAIDPDTFRMSRNPVTGKCEFRWVGGV